MEQIPDISREHISSSLRWDGTFLGTYGVNSIQEKITTVNKITFATIHTKAFETKCILKRTKNPNEICLLDELKECFGIEKMGTHRIRLGNAFYVMIRCQDRSGDSSQSLFFTLKNDLKVDEAFKAEMRKLICYRMLLRIPNTNNRSFLVIKCGAKYKPYSFVEMGISVDISPKPPTGRFLKKWFGDRDISSEMINIFPKRICEEWSEFLFGFRSVLDDKICQVDKEYVWLTSFIIEKMNSLC